MEQWLDEWPKEPGYYWFYGKRFGKGEPKLCYVEVHRTSVKSVPSYVTHGHFMYKQEGCTGKWQKVVLPELPED